MSIVRQGSAALGNNGGSTNTFSASYTVNAASNYLVVPSFGPQASATATAVYGGESMTLLGYVAGNVPNVSGSTYLWGLANPPTGANTLLITTDVTGYIVPLAIDYSGVGSAGNVLTYTNQTTSETSISAPGTVSVADSVLIGYICDGLWIMGTASSTALNLVLQDSFPISAYFDATETGTGSVPNTFSWTPSNYINAIVAALAPVSMGSPFSGPPFGFAQSLGVGDILGGLTARALLRNSKVTRRDLMTGRGLL
jgi:hypothetical protein